MLTWFAIEPMLTAVNTGDSLNIKAIVAAVAAVVVLAVLFLLPKFTKKK